MQHNKKRKVNEADRDALQQLVAGVATAVKRTCPGMCTLSHSRTRLILGCDADLHSDAKIYHIQLLTCRRLISASIESTKVNMMTT